METHLWKRSGIEISETGLVYLNQMLDMKGERLITWQQFKNYRGQSSKGKKAEWFKEIELKVLEGTLNREVKEHFRTKKHNTQAMKIEWKHLSEDRRKKEWIIYGAQDCRQLEKIVKKKKKKILLEHWQMRSKKNELATEISKCEGCTEEEEERVEGSCQQWIRANSKIKVIPDAAIEKSNSKIKLAIDQLTENVDTEKLKNSEQRLEGLKMIEELEVEIIKRQKLNENVNQEILKMLRRNLVRNKNKYIIYTDGAVNVNVREEMSTKNTGIGWIQTDETQEWPEEEISLGLEG